MRAVDGDDSVTVNIRCSNGSRFTVPAELGAWAHRRCVQDGRGGELRSSRSVNSILSIRGGFSTTIGPLKAMMLAP